MGSLAVLSTVIGAGIVGVPFSMYQTGIPLGIVINIAIALGMQYSCLLYFEAKKLVPVPINSIYELSYVNMGRGSIFLVSTIQGIQCSGQNVIYFIVFG
jgi:amino acid permease